jgi:hypothetical protein
MSDLLNSASLVMIPSGYKEDVVYSQIPTDGSGDLSFTRASNGTRINSAGLVEVTPWNLLQYSEDLSNAVWTTANLSISANTTTAPNGTTTADTITEDTSTTRKILYTTPTIVANQEITLTIYVKKNTLQYVRLIANDLSENFRWFGAQFNLTALTYTSATGSNGNATFTSASITDAGNGWYRIAVSGTINTTSLLFGIFPSDGTALSSSDDRGGNTYLGTGKTAYIWGAQLNIGSTAKPYFPTTDRLNVPRLTYQNGGGGCPSLLLEKQSTNLAVQSNAFNTSPWVSNEFNGTNPVITANYGISPDGTQNAARIQLARTNTSTSYSQIYQYPINVTNGASYTWSVWLKSLSGTPTISIIGDFGRPPVTLTSEWVRYSGTGTASSSLSQLEIAILGSNFASGNSLTADFLAWGYQFEQSSYPTSYIPTTSASATRVADACFKTGISSLIGQTEGTILWDIQVDIASGPESILNLDAGSFANTIYLIKGTNSSLGVEMYASSILQSTFTLSSITAGRYKMAIGYANNNTAFFINGTQVGTTDTTCSVPAMSRLQMGNTIFGPSDGKVNQVTLFKTRLTNAELASLTTI